MTAMSEAFVTTQDQISENQSLGCQFRQAKFRGLIGKIWGIIKRRPNILMDVKYITLGKAVRSSRHVGSQTVRIQQIKGSEGRCQDFDQNFNPLKSHNQNRWISIARAWQRGTYLPAVDLIKVGDAYIVRDGHHRISVARFMGCNFVDAHVTEWVLEE